MEKEQLADWRKDHKEKGLCRYCVKEVVVGKTMCQYHLDYIKYYNKFNRLNKKRKLKKTKTDIQTHRDNGISKKQSD